MVPGLSIFQGSTVEASVSPLSISEVASGSIGTTSTSATASGSGGSAPYSYSWSQVSGPILVTPNSASSATTDFDYETPFTGFFSATMKCVVTDNNGFTGEVFLPIFITYPSLP